MVRKGIYITFFTFIIAILTIFYVFDIKKVSGNSMYPTIENGSTIIINRLKYGLKKPFSDNYFFLWQKPEKNEIIMFKEPVSSKLIIKRVCGVVGDKILVENGRLNTSKGIYFLEESDYLYKCNGITIPDGSVMVLGDNSLDSIDSRNYGFIKIENILGEVLVKESGKDINEQKRL